MLAKPFPAQIEQERKPRYFAALTGIRAAAAFLVFFHHTNPLDHRLITTSPRLPQTTLFQWAERFIQQWHVGVAIFFVLSGFLITTRYMDKIQPTWQWARFYFQNRFARIYPVYFLVTLLTLALCFSGVSWAPAGELYWYSLRDKIAFVVANVTLVRAYFSNWANLGVGPAWTLTVEESFYAIAPFLLLALRRDMRRVVFYPLLFFVLGCLLVWVAALLPIHPYGFMKSVKFMLALTFFGRSTEFICGIALALVIRRYPVAPRATCWATIIGIVWVALCMSYMAVDVPYQHTYVLETTASLVANNLVMPVGIAVFFWGLLHEQSILRRLLETPLLQLLGKSSYAFYLIHIGVLSAFLQTFVTVRVSIHFMIAIALSILLFKFVEEPLHRKLRANPL